MKAKVENIESGRLTLLLYPDDDSNECKGCSMESGCGLRKVDSITLNQSKETTSLKVNEFIDVEIPPHKIVLLSSLVYLLPLLCMIAAALLVRSYSETIIIFSAFSGLFAGFLINYVCNKFLSLDKLVVIRSMK